MKIAIALAVAVLGAPTAFAQPTQAQKPKPTIVNEPGKPVQAIWPSGNVAEMVLSRQEPLSLPVEFEVTENLCTQSIGHKLKLMMGVRFDLLEWRWLTHKDAEKVGKNLKVSTRGVENDIAVSVFFSSGTRYLEPRLAEGLPEDELHFEGSINWLPGMADGVMRPLDIQSWNAETMTRNPETGAGQNRIVSGEIGPRLEPVKGQNLKARIVHDATGGFFTDLINHGFYYLGDVVSWVFPTDTGTCFIGFKPNVGKAVGILTDSIVKGKFERKPYTAGTDGLSELAMPFLKNDIENANE